MSAERTLRARPRPQRTFPGRRFVQNKVTFDTEIFVVSFSRKDSRPESGNGSLLSERMEGRHRPSPSCRCCPQSGIAGKKVQRTNGKRRRLMGGKQMPGGGLAR